MHAKLLLGAISVVVTLFYANKDRSRVDEMYTPRAVYIDTMKISREIDEEFNAANPATAVGNAFTDEQKQVLAKKSNLSKEDLVQRYISRFKKTAIQESNKYNIPASIILAQGIIESNAGQSRLARRENNHFGIKCRANCIGCKCANYADDDPNDMFRVYKSAWESYRDHSKLIVNTPRYKKLLRLKRTDYKGWSHGLQKAGYATNKQYAKILINIIQKYKLHKYDI